MHSSIDKPRSLEFLHGDEGATVEGSVREAQVSAIVVEKVGELVASVACGFARNSGSDL